MPATLRPPGPKNPLPVGAIIKFFRQPTEFLTAMARQYGDIAHLRVGPRHVFLLNHPDYVKEMLVTNAAVFAKGKLMEGARRVLGEGLLTSSGEKHVRQRRATAPGFHRQRIDQYAQTMVECAARTVGAWRTRDVLDIHAEMMRLTLAIVGRTLFSAELERDSELCESLNAFIRMSPLALLPFMEAFEKLPIAPMRRIENALKQLDNAVYRLIGESRRGSGDNLLAMLLEQYGRNVTDRELRDECVALIFAGYETTSNALAWTAYLLSQNPEPEAKLHAEIGRELQGRLPTVDDLPRLQYTARVLSESVRLYPPAWAIGRRAMAPAMIGGYPVPKNSLLIVSQWVLHRDARYFADPCRFDPERWTPEAQRDRPHFCYFPFGAGPRQCIGESFAWTEAILLLATIAQNWRLRLVPGHPVEPQAVVTLRPKFGMRMIVEQW